MNERRPSRKGLCCVYISIIYLVFFLGGRGWKGRGVALFQCVLVTSSLPVLLFLDNLNKEVNNRFGLTFTIIFCAICYLLFISHKNS